MQVRIYFVIDTLQTGGAEKSIVEIASRLSENLDVTIVTFYQSVSIIEVPANLKTKHFNLKGKYDFKKAIALFDEYCKLNKPDIVVATLFRSEYISRIVCHRNKIINVGTFVNDTYSKYELASLSLFKKIKIGWFWLLNWYTANYCHSFISNAESIKRSNAKALFINESKIHVIPRGRDLSKYKFFNHEISKQKTRFVNVGRLLPRKGQGELIKAFSLLLKKHPNCELQIAGEGSYRKELELLIEKLKLKEKVILLGNVNNIPLLLNTADVFVFPSWYEGFSGALVEAMLCGIPILASDIEMNKEAIIHNKTGYLFQVQNVQSLYEALQFSIEHKDRMIEFAKAARKTAEAQYDIDVVVNKHVEYYKAVYENRSAYSKTST